MAAVVRKDRDVRYLVDLIVHLSEELHGAAPAKSELHLLPGRYHEPINDLGSDEVFDLIAGWLSKK